MSKIRLSSGLSVRPFMVARPYPKSPGSAWTSIKGLKTVGMKRRASLSKLKSRRRKMTMMRASYLKIYKAAWIIATITALYPASRVCQVRSLPPSSRLNYPQYWSSHFWYKKTLNRQTSWIQCLWLAKIQLRWFSRSTSRSKSLAALKLLHSVLRWRRLIQLGTILVVRNVDTHPET